MPFQVLHLLIFREKFRETPKGNNKKTHPSHLPAPITPFLLRAPNKRCGFARSRPRGSNVRWKPWSHGWNKLIQPPTPPRWLSPEFPKLGLANGITAIQDWLDTTLPKKCQEKWGSSTVAAWVDVSSKKYVYHLWSLCWNYYSTPFECIMIPTTGILPSLSSLFISMKSGSLMVKVGGFSFQDASWDFPTLLNRTGLLKAVRVNPTWVMISGGSWSCCDRKSKCHN